MVMRKSLAAAVLLQFLTIPGMAQNENAHHYQGGPKTEVPHMLKHPEASKEDTAKSTKRTTGKKQKQDAHRYQGGPKSTEPHRM